MVMVDLAAEQVGTTVALVEINAVMVEKADCCVVVVIGVDGDGDRSGTRCTHWVDCCDPFLPLSNFNIYLFFN